MKIIINENERGFLFKNGSYQRMLLPGKYHITKFLGESYARADITKPVHITTADNALLLKDKLFAQSVTTIDVPDGHIAVHMEDGKTVGTLLTGSYCFWNCYHSHTFKQIDMTNPLITELNKEQLQMVPYDLYIKFEVPEGEIGLLFYDGKLERTLNSGSYLFWNTMTKISVINVDMRTQQLDISGQDILTADKVSLRLNFVCNYKIIDALNIVTKIKDYKLHIYTLTQLVLREYVGKFRFDELLEQKDSIAGYVLEQLRMKQGVLFVEFSDCGLKDIILPGEIRDIMNTVLIAEKNAQANVIARREEVASTRSLLNTAKLMDENATLFKLKELEYLEKICERVGNISVGGGNLLSELRAIVNQ